MIQILIQGSRSIMLHDIMHYTQTISHSFSPYILHVDRATDIEGVVFDYAIYVLLLNSSLCING